MTTSLPRAMPVRSRRVSSSAPSKSETTSSSQSWVTMRAACVQRPVEARRGLGHDRGGGGERRVARRRLGEQAQDGGAARAGRAPRRGRRRRARCRRRGRPAPRMRHAASAATSAAVDGLHRVDGAEEHRLALVDEEQRRAVALLARHPDVGAAGAGGDLPVDGADVVAGQVDAEFLEFEPAAAHPRRPAAGKGAADRLAGKEVEAAGAAPPARRGGRGRCGCAGPGAGTSLLERVDHLPVLGHVDDLPALRRGGVEGAVEACRRGCRGRRRIRARHRCGGRSGRGAGRRRRCVTRSIW